MEHFAEDLSQQWPFAAFVMMAMEAAAFEARGPSEALPDKHQ